MEQLIANIVSKVGIDEGLAKTAIGIILNMFKDAAPADKMSALTDAMPGADSLMAEAPAADQAGAGGGGLMGGLGGMVAGALGGGGDNPMMAALGQLQAQGLSMGQAQQVGQEVASYAREQAGDDVVKDIAASIPGLSAML